LTGRRPSPMTSWRRSRRPSRSTSIVPSTNYRDASRVSRGTEVSYAGAMSTPVGPAESYARFRERQAAPELASFRDLYGFDFDPFQIAACTALTKGDGVLVAAPTGSGKTVVGEYAVHL